jgi:hypothetical protein
VEIEEFGKAKEAFFTELLTLPNGISSHDTFGPVFALLDPRQFEASFVQQVQRMSQTVQGVVAIDGKTLRRSHDRAAGKKALHTIRDAEILSHLDPEKNGMGCEALAWFEQSDAWERK